MKKFNYFYRKVERKRKGFTLIEVIIALAILAIIIVGTLNLLASSYASTQDSEMRSIAKNIATYTVEYIRSRNVTADNPLGHSQDEFYNPTTNPNAYYPGLVDIQDNPLDSNGSYGSVNGELNGSKCINTHPALPNETYQAYKDRTGNTHAFYYSLQGYVSLLKNPSSGPFFPNHSSEDANLYIDNKNHYYHNRDVNNGGVHTVNRLVVRFPFYATDSDNAIKDFSQTSDDYYPMVYTSDTNKTDPTKSEYNPFYTDDPSLINRTRAYRGFRVLISIAARKKHASDPDHVQYYDVKVTVFWMAGKQEHSYSLATQIVTYGGG